MRRLTGLALSSVCVLALLSGCGGADSEVVPGGHSGSVAPDSATEAPVESSTPADSGDPTEAPASEESAPQADEGGEDSAPERGNGGGSGEVDDAGYRDVGLGDATEMTTFTGAEAASSEPGRIAAEYYAALTRAANDENWGSGELKDLSTGNMQDSNSGVLGVSGQGTFIGPVPFVATEAEQLGGTANVYGCTTTGGVTRDDSGEVFGSVRAVGRFLNLVSEDGELKVDAVVEMPDADCAGVSLEVEEW